MLLGERHLLGTLPHCSQGAGQGSGYVPWYGPASGPPLPSWDLASYSPLLTLKLPPGLSWAQFSTQSTTPCESLGRNSPMALAS